MALDDGKKIQSYYDCDFFKFSASLLCEPKEGVKIEPKLTTFMF